MATLSGNKIKDTYQSLIKLTDNGNLTTGAKQLTDGFGNNSPLYISTTQIGIGVTPETGYDLHVYSNAKVGGNLTITGDLTVNGTTTTVDTDTLRVEDPLIEVARNNTSSDSLDIGIYGKYAPSATTLYSGLFRDAGDDKFKLFKNLEEEPTTTVNTSGTGYTKAGLVIGGLEATTGDFTDTVTVDGAIEVENSSGFGRIEIGGSSGGYIDLKSPFSDDFDLRLYTAGTNAQINALNGELDITAYTNINLQNQGTDVLTIESSRVLFSQQAVFGNDIKALFGGSSDLQIYHSATGDSYIVNNTGNLIINSSGITGTAIKDEDNMASNSASHLATQQSIKAYVDTQVGANNELSEVLANGNTTGGTDIAITAGDKITNFTSTGIDDNATSTSLTIDSSGRVSTSEEFIATEGNRKGFRLIAGYGNWEMIASTSANHLILHSESLAADYVTIKGGGQVQFNDYGSGSFTGTATYRLAVDSSGDVIEIPIGDGAVDGSGAAGQVAFWTDTDTIDGENNLYWDSTNDRLGIGDSTPSYKLDVNGDIQVNETIIARSGSDLILQARASQVVGINSGGSRTMTLDASQRVGIGTTSPNNKLEISNGAAQFNGGGIDSNLGEAILFGNTTYPNAQKNRIRSSISASSTGNLLVLEAGTSTAGTYNNNQLVLRGDGNVGIGTTSPTGKLQLESTSAGAATVAAFLVNSSTSLNTETRLAFAAHTNSDIATNRYSYISTINTSGSNGQDMIFATNATGESGTERMRITSSSNPTLRLGVSGTGTSIFEMKSAGGGSSVIDVEQFLQIKTSGSERMRINSSGNVGIGLTNPSARLNVYGTGAANDPTLAVDTTSSAEFNHAIEAFNGNLTNGENNVVLIGKEGNTKNAGYIAYKWFSSGSNSNILTFGHWGSDNLMNLTGDGNLGIGTTSPVQPLHVNGQVLFRTTTADGGKNRFQLIPGGSSDAANLYLYYGNSGDGTLSVRINAQGDSYFNGGNVGIGTTSPSRKLEVAGDLRVDGLSSGTSVSFGGTGDFAIDAPGVGGGRFIVKHSSGNVGIGTASPSAKLNTFESNNLYDPQILVQTDTTSVVSYMGIATNKLKFYRNVSTGVNFEIQTSVSSGSSGGHIVFMPNAGNHTPTERMRLTTAGNVGIGTSSPSHALDVTSGAYDQVQWTRTSGVSGYLYSDSAGAGIYSGASISQAGIYLKPNISMDFRVNGSIRMLIDGAGDSFFKGNITIDGFAGGKYLSLRDATCCNNPSGSGGVGLKAIDHSGSANDGLGIYGHDGVSIYTIQTKRMQVDSSGHSRFTTSGSFSYGPGYNFHEIVNNYGGEPTLVVANTATGNPNNYGINVIHDSTTANTTGRFFLGQTASTERIKIFSNGNIQNSNNSYGQLSDRKLKENIEDATPKLDDLMQVQIKNFNYIDDDTKQIGVIAQELEEVFPALIYETPDTERQDINKTDEDGNIIYKTEEVLVSEAVEGQDAVYETRETDEPVTENKEVDLGTTTKAVKYSVFVPIMIKAMQEQQQIIEDLKARIEILENN
ncbi:hypothetical protein [uncultured Mediterranean phage uvDeep1-CGR2-KM23-C896]|nr:hypothetical protein [uncultured Mediterranean phage uvDeep1-CGR2-KM23-C896]